MKVRFLLGFVGAVVMLPNRGWRRAGRAGSTSSIFLRARTTSCRHAALEREHAAPRGNTLAADDGVGARAVLSWPSSSIAAARVMSRACGAERRCRQTDATAARYTLLEQACCTKARCRRCRDRSCCAHAPASSPSAAGAARRASSHRSSGATASSSTRCAAARRSCSGSSTTSTTSSSYRCARARAGVGVEPELIVVDSFPGRPSFAGLGELTADELESLWPSRSRATAAVARCAAEAWAALRAPEPDRSRRLAARDDRAPAVPRARATAPARRAPGAGRRPLADGAIGARDDRRRRANTARGVRRDTTARGSAVPRRHVVLPHAVGARQGENRLVEGDGAPLPPPPPLSDGQSFMRLEFA